MARAIDANELMVEIQVCSWDSEQDKERAEDLVLGMPTLTPPNEPLTLEDAKKERYIWFTPLNDWAKVTSFVVLFFGSEEMMSWETLCEEWGYRFKAYRRPPEGEDNEKTNT